MDSDTFYRDCLVKLIWTLFGNLIYHVVSIETHDNLQTNFTKKNLHKNITLNTVPK